MFSFNNNIPQVRFQKLSTGITIKKKIAAVH